MYLNFFMTKYYWWCYVIVLKIWVSSSLLKAVVFYLGNRISYLFVVFIAVIQIYMYYYAVRYWHCVFHQMSLNWLPLLIPSLSLFTKFDHTVSQHHVCTVKDGLHWGSSWNWNPPRLACKAISITVVGLI